MEQKQKLFVKPEAIIKYMLGTSEELDTLITCKGDSVNMITTDQALYEALGSIGRDKIDYAKLIKFLEVTEITSLKQWKNQDRTILTPERAEQLRKGTKGDTNE